MQIKVEHLNYTYSKGNKNLAVKALSDINLEINEGDFFGIIGHTGSGKSTFVQHLNGLIKVDKESGKITIGEFDLSDKKCDYKSLRSRVGMVFQYPEYQLFAETVFDDVAFGLKNFYPSLNSTEVEDRVRKALELVGLNYFSVKDRSPFEFSGGQKRRIAIAGVLVTEPEILVLDEPVAGLDPVGKKDFLSLLNTLKQMFVKTIIIVTHDMNIVSEYCNRVAVFSHGKIVKEGSPSDVFNDRKEIESLGLELPVTVSLFDKLKEKGIDIPLRLKREEFIGELIKKFSRGEKR
ncbi:MAG: energy-coupling factor transporter ATPase [Firmicutes bacterium]|nr:energy-coupling factor transporter ATPase [Candidatus Caballimonas caccae]